MQSSDRIGNAAVVVACCLVSVSWLCHTVQGAEQVVRNDPVAAGNTGNVQAGFATTALPPSVFSCTRASDAYLIDRDGATFFAPNTLRTEKVTSFSSHEGAILGHQDNAEPLAIDHINGDVISTGPESSTLLSRTKDGDDYTIIVDVNTHPLIVSGSGTQRLTCVVVAGDYLVMWVNDGTFDTIRPPGSPGARAYRMERGDDGQWDPDTIVEIWQSLYGTAIHFSANTRGLEVMWGEYIKLATGYDPQRRGCGTFYIDDISVPNPSSRVTKVASDPEVVPVTTGVPPVVVTAGSGSHMHAFIADPVRADTWYALSGDGIGNTLRRLVKPSGWIPGQMFVTTTVENRIGAEGMAILDDKLYLGIEGPNALGTTPGHLVRYDLADYTQRDNLLAIPHLRSIVKSGTVSVAPTFDEVSNKSTITATVSTFNSSDVGRDFIFAGTANRYLITDFVSVAQVLVNGDASGESALDAFTVKLPGGPYKLVGGGEDLGEGAFSLGGAVYLPTFTFNAPSGVDLNKGIYVGHGGDRFSTYIRFKQDRGIHRILGELNGRFVFAYEDSGLVARVGFVDIPSTQTVDAIVVEKGSQNIIGNTVQSASFEGVVAPLDNGTNLFTNLWWRNQGNADRGSAMIDTTAGLHGATAIKIIPPNESPATSNVFATQWWNSLPNLPPAALSLMSFSVWARLGSATKAGISVEMRPISPANYPNASDLGPTDALEPGTSWGRYVNTGKSVNLTEPVDRMEIVQRGFNALDLTGAELFLDLPMFEIDTDRWRTYSSTWLPANLTRPDEIVSTTIDLTLASEWSLFFEWHPLEARENFLVDIPIISVAGSGGSFLQIIWDHVTNKFKVENASGFTSATLETNWRHLDAIKFILASDGVDTTLHVWDPEQGTNSTAMLGRQMTAATDSMLRLGTDNELSEVGCGRYADIRLYGVKLTNSGAIMAFATLEIDPCIGFPRGDFTAPVGVDGRDLQLFVDALISTSPTQDQVCRGDFDDNLALDDGDVDGMVAALLAGP